MSKFTKKHLILSSATLAIVAGAGTLFYKTHSADANNATHVTIKHVPHDTDNASSKKLKVSSHKVKDAVKKANEKDSSEKSTSSSSSSSSESESESVSNVDDTSVSEMTTDTTADATTDDNATDTMTSTASFTVIDDDPTSADQSNTEVDHAPTPRPLQKTQPVEQPAPETTQPAQPAPQPEPKPAPAPTRTDGVNWNGHHFDLASWSDMSGGHVPQWTNNVFQWTGLPHYYLIEQASAAGQVVGEMAPGTPVTINGVTYHVDEIQNFNRATSFDAVAAMNSRHAVSFQTCVDIYGNTIKVISAD